MIDKVPSEHESQPEHRLVPHFDGYADRLPSPFDMDENVASAQPNLVAAYWHAFRRRWFLAVTLGMLSAAIAAAAVWSTNKDEFTATFQFLVSPNDDPNRPGVPSADFVIVKNTQQQYIKSDWVLTAALRDPKVSGLPVIKNEPDPVRWLAREIRIAFPGNGAEMNLSLTTESANQSALLIASVSKAYLDEVVNQEQLFRTQRISDYEKILEDKRKSRLEKREALNKLSASQGTGDSQTLLHKQRMIQENLSFLRNQLITIRFQVRQTEADLKTQRSDYAAATQATGDAKRTLLTDMDREATFNSDDILGTLQLQIDALNENLKTLRLHATAQQRATKEQEINKQIAELQQKIATRKQVLENDLVRFGTMSLDKQIAQLEVKLEAAKSMETDFTAQEAALLKELDQFGQSPWEMEVLQKEIKDLDDLISITEKTCQQLRDELLRPARVSRNTRVKSDTPDKKTLDKDLSLEEMAEAIRPNSADPKSQLSKTAAAGLAGCGLVVGLILVLEVRTKRVNSSLDVSRSLGLPVIGAVPLIPSRAITRTGNNSARYCHWRTLLNESMRGVMVRLLHEARTVQSQVVMVSSASPGEGKSTLATNLAVAMARAGYSTLLVDFDLRRPTLGDLFDLPLSPGVSEILRQEFSFEDTVNEVSTANLSVLTAGAWSPHHVGVLANGDTERLFEDLRSRYQFIVVDGSPILGVAEAQLLCRHADTVLLSVLRDVSSSPKITAACETLSAFGVRSLYAVVTGTANSDYAYHYGNYGNSTDADFS